MMYFPMNGPPPEPMPYSQHVATYIIGKGDWDAYFLTVYRTGEVWNWDFPLTLMHGEEPYKDLSSFRYPCR